PADATGLAADVLAFVRQRDATHPQDLAPVFGRERAVNGWGGFSKATTRALHSLHHHGLLRVVGRRDGIRIYAAAPAPPAPFSPPERVRRIVLLMTRILSPVPETSLRAAFGLFARRTPGLGRIGGVIKDLLATGELACGEVDRVRYLWPAGVAADDVPRDVRF